MNAMTQDLFSAMNLPHVDMRIATPAARCTDPESSHEAAEEHTRSGKRHTQRQLVAAAVRANPGMTASELAKRCDLDRHMVSKRTAESRTAGDVRNTPCLETEENSYKHHMRKCRITGKRVMCWWPA